MNEELSTGDVCQEKDLSLIKSNLIRTQEELEKLIYTGQEIMDRVCIPEVLPGKEPVMVKSIEAQNLIGNLKEISRANDALVKKLSLLITRMNSVF